MMVINHKQLLKRYRVPFRAGFRLARIDPDDMALFKKSDKAEVKELLAAKATGAD